MKNIYYIKIEELWLGFQGELVEDFEKAKVFQGEIENQISYLDKKGYDFTDIKIFKLSVDEIHDLLKELSYEKPEYKERYINKNRKDKIKKLKNEKV